MHLLSLQFLTYEDFNPFMDVVLRHHVGLEFLAGVNSYWGGCMREVWHSVQGRGIIVRGDFFVSGDLFLCAVCHRVGLEFLAVVKQWWGMHQEGEHSVRRAVMGLQ